MLSLIRRSVGLPVLSEAQSREATPRGSFVVLTDDSFTIYKPWASMRELGREGALSADITLGPAVVGRVVSEGAGCRVDVHMRPYPPPPSQRTRFAIAVAVFAAFVLAPLVLGGTHPVALGIASISLLGGVAAPLHRRSDRAQDLRELLATVERVLGPAELGALDDAPHRQIGAGAQEESEH